MSAFLRQQSPVVLAETYKLRSLHVGIHFLMVEHLLCAVHCAW